MVVPVVLFVVSVAGILAGLGLPGQSDLLLLAVPCAVASLILGLRASVRRAGSGRSGSGRAATPQPVRPARPWARRKGVAPAPRWIVIDGSNVMHWKDGTPRIDVVREVLALLVRRGFTPGVVFDANAGYLVSGQYQHHGSFARMLGLPEDRVMVVPKGEPADATVLLAARDLGARVVTNDQFRDWADAHPEVRQAGYLIKGGYRDGTLWLGPGDPAAPADPPGAVPVR